MALSDVLLNAFAAPPGDARAQRAFSQVKSALSNPYLSSRSFDPYLQGSYKNATHIKEDSDVDVVAELSSTFSYDDSLLDARDKARFHTAFPSPATYAYSDFRRDVGAVLRAHFGASAVQEGTKCFNIAASSDRVAADVLPCLEHRVYGTFPSLDDRDAVFIRGIKFYTPKDGWVVNWPRLHYDHGVEKNKATDDRFRAIVRIAKNLRGILADARVIDVDEASSYHIECLIFNVPDFAFIGTNPVAFRATFRHLETADITGFKCVNKIDSLIGGTKGWALPAARKFIDSILLLDRMVKP